MGGSARGIRRPAPGRGRNARRAHRALQGPAGAVQGPQSGDVRRCAPSQSLRKSPQARTPKWNVSERPIGGTTTRVNGPVTGGRKGWAFGGPAVDLAALGYQQEEYFFEGEAARYGPEPGTQLGRDG